MGWIKDQSLSWDELELSIWRQNHNEEKRKNNNDYYWYFEQVYISHFIKMEGHYL